MPTRREFLAVSLASSLSLAAEPERKMRVAIIGHTKRGDYGHGIDAMWAHVSGTELVAIADADADGLTKAIERLKVPGYRDYKGMLSEVKPDIVAVAPRFIDEHREMILAAIDRGAKGIYCEKSFCRTPAEADEIIAAAKAKNVKIAVAHRNRWHPVLPVVRKLLKDEAIGRVLEMRARGKEDARGGALDLWVLGSHLFNLAQFFGGKPLACTATVTLADKPVVKADLAEGAEGVGPLAGDEVHARFEMEHGLPLVFDSVKNAGVKEAGFGLQIIGTRGVIDFRIDKEPLAQMRMGSPFAPVKEPSGWTPIALTEPVANLEKDLMAHALGGRDLLAAIRENRPTLCDASDAALTVEMICAVFESHRLNGQRVTLPLKTRVNPLTLLN